MPPKKRKQPAPKSDPGELGTLMKEVAKDQGQEIMVSAANLPPATHLPLKNFILDFATLGGIMESCGHMIYGNANSGKTTLWLQVVTSILDKYPTGYVVWVDVEKKFDPEWAKRHGVDIDRVRVVRPPTGEAAVDIIDAAMRTLEVKGVVLDSIPSLLPFQILEKSAEDMTVGARARLVGLLCSKVQQAWIDELRRGHKVTFLCINQFREKIGQMFGDPRTLPGGRFQEYMVDTKLEIKCEEIFPTTKKMMAEYGIVDEGFKPHVMNKHAFKFTKTKGGFSLKQGEFLMVMDDSVRSDGMVCGEIDDFETVVNFARSRDIITGGAPYYLKGYDNKFASKAEVIAFLRGNPEIDLDIRRAIIVRQRMASKVPAYPPDNYLLGKTTVESRQRALALLKDEQPETP